MQMGNMRIVSALVIAASLNSGIITNALPAWKDITVNKLERFTGIKAENVLFPKTSSDAVTLWAEALSQRSGAFRYAILTNDLKKQEYKSYAESNWVIGVSSPWILNYTISEKSKIDDKTYEYTIEYILSDSTKALYNASENLTVTKLNSEWYVTKHEDSNYLPENLDIKGNSKFSKFQDRLSNDDLLPRDKESTVKLWAEALNERNGAFRYAILDKTLKNSEYDKYDKMIWVIGGSSPKVVSYKITEKNRIDDKTSEYGIDYTLTDSTKMVYYAHEDITIANSGSRWYVTKHDNYDYFPNVTEKPVN